ncbi:hypothetical protein OD350_29025 (plasmid) [Clostridium beijerinckii]|uniref:hypothetical protein n=1 Tax=Clostridium beijerinckii TaxID=1520 RepID=UPI0022271E9C|nr:hypothetical protein [Clostridium beijerinckii]UYZ39118.1 hypothetical protein OD350_29025 [Clostridium beijerinckii]
MKKSKSKVLISILMLILTLGSVPVSAEEIKIGNFRNIIAGSNSSKLIDVNLESEGKIGWQKVSGTWFYIEASGTKKIGWFYDNGRWYYFDNTGCMMRNIIVDGYKLNSEGEWER